MSVLVIDTETTGLGLHAAAPLDKQPYIIEFGAVVLSRTNGKELDRLQQLIKPPIAIPPDSTKIHRITDADVVGAPVFAKAWPRIAKMLLHCDAVIAHNAPFDETMLDFELKRNNIMPGRWPPFVDTIGLYRPHFGYDVKLTELYEHVLGKKLAQTHRAMEDVEALVAVVQKARLWQL